MNQSILLTILLCFHRQGTRRVRCSWLVQGSVWLNYLVLIRFIPVMITRMIISLKKSASKPHMNMETPSAFTLGLQDSECTTRTADGIPLSVLKT